MFSEVISGAVPNTSSTRSDRAAAKTASVTLGRSLPTAPKQADVATAAMAAIKARGRSDVGHKTLIDVLEPVCKGLAEGADASSHQVALATAAADCTVAMQSLRGRAAFLGEDSIGHMDPGARSTSLMIAAAVDALDLAGSERDLTTAPAS